MYLHNILNRSEGELVKRVYVAQRNNPTKGDFIELVKQDLNDIGEDFDEEKIRCQTKTIFKAHIKNKIKEAVFTKLKDTKKTHSKIRDITYDQFKIQPYLNSFSLTTEMTKILFNMRSAMTRNFKCNFSSMFKGDLRCSLKCSNLDQLDQQSHLLHCEAVK